ARRTQGPDPQALGVPSWGIPPKNNSVGPDNGGRSVGFKRRRPRNSGFVGLAGRRRVARRKGIFQRLVYGGFGIPLGGVVGRDGDGVAGGEGVFQGLVEVALDRILFQIRVSRGRGCAYAGSRGGIHKLAPAKFEQWRRFQPSRSAKADTPASSVRAAGGRVGQPCK